MMDDRFFQHDEIISSYRERLINTTWGKESGKWEVLYVFSIRRRGLNFYQTKKSGG